MGEAHPKLCFRLKARVGLQRPTLQHAVLGTLEFINHGGGWWQGTTTVSGSTTRLDLQQTANPSQPMIDFAAECLQWIQQNEPNCRDYIGRHLASGEFNSNLRRHSRAKPITCNPETLRALRPTMVVLWSDHAELQYECDALPDGNLEGGHRIELLIDERLAPQLVWLLALDFSNRAQRLFERPLPPEAVDFENSLADQLIAKAAEGPLRIDGELRDLLDQAIDTTENRITQGSPDTVAYMVSAKTLLWEIAKMQQAVVERIFVNLRFRHPTGNRIPIKQKLVIAPTDQVRFDDSGAFPRVDLFSVDHEDEGGSIEDFACALRSRLRAAATWLAKQLPAVFNDLRSEGFATEVSIYVVAKIEVEFVEIPPEFLAECSRHGLTMIITMTNSAGW